MPKVSWVKVNGDGAARGCPRHVARREIFKGRRGELGIRSSFYAKLMATIYASEISKIKNYKRIWLECESTLVCHAFENPKVVLEAEDPLAESSNHMQSFGI